MKVILGIESDLFLKPIMGLKFKIYLKFLTQNIMNAFRNLFD